MNKKLKNEVKYHSPASHPYKQMDNISKFVASCAILGVGPTFDVGDLHQGRNWPRVLSTLRALARLFGEGPTKEKEEPRPALARLSGSQGVRHAPSSRPTSGIIAAPPPASEPHARERTWIAEVLHDTELARLDNPPPLLARLK